MAGTPDVIIVGGGVIGLSIAWYLARQGVSCRVLERDRLGSHASSAAAGMLAPLAESEEIGPLFRFGKASLDLYPTFLEQLAFDSGIEVFLEGPGLLRIAFNGSDADRLRDLAESEAGKEMQAEWLDERQVHEMQPGVPDAACGAIFSPQEKDIDPRRLVQALIRACERLEVSFMEGLPAERAVNLITEDQKAIYCAGAWTGEVLGAIGHPLPVRPVKGQVAVLQQPGKELRYTLYGHGGYLVPREGGAVLIGATSEDAGFDERATEDGIEYLLDKAVELYPAAEDFEFIEAYASVRPGTADDLPILGRLPSLPNTYVATGHYRNGILQTPITAKLMSEMILSGREPETIAPFSPSRFSNIGVS